MNEVSGFSISARPIRSCSSSNDDTCDIVDVSALGVVGDTGYQGRNCAPTAGVGSLDRDNRKIGKVEMNAQKIKVAVAQSATTLFDSVAAVDLVAQWAERAAAQQVELLVFPEAFIGGYPRGTAFGATVGNRTNEGRELFRQYFDGAILIPGPLTDRMGEIARSHNLYLVVGVIEREATTLYCSVVFFSPDGNLLGKRRKLMPTGAERLVWGFGDGSTMNVYDTTIGRLGAVICWENLMPAARIAMYAQGIELYCAPTADGRESHHATMRHIAQEGRCFVLAANQVTRVSDFPPDFPHGFGDDPDLFVSHGGSSIIGPLGEVLAGPVYDREILLTADIDRDDIVRAKFDFDVVGHYARPDVFRLLVDESAHPAVASYQTESDF